MSQYQSEFPNNRSELNYALSDEPILLNGMKVIFDQSASVYPVNLQPKNGKLLNTSLAKSLSDNIGFSGALDVSNEWNEILDLTIEPKLFLNSNKRLDELIKDPWKLDQANEGNCGFASVMMAMLYLAGDEDEKKKVLIDLLKAIFYGNEYKGMKVTKENTGTQNRDSAAKGIINTRLKKRLSAYDYDMYREYGITISLPKNIADYVLIVGLMLFFKDYLKNGDQKKKMGRNDEVQ